MKKIWQLFRKAYGLASLYLELSSSQKMIMMTGGLKKKKKCTWRGVHVLLCFYKWLLPLCILQVYPRALLVAESKENIYSEYVDFGVEIIVKNYRIFLVVFLFIGYCYNFFFNYLIIEYSAWKLFQVIFKDFRGSVKEKIYFEIDFRGK